MHYYEKRNNTKKERVQAVKKFLVCQTVHSIDNVLIIRLI